MIPRLATLVASLVIACLSSGATDGLAIPASFRFVVAGGSSDPGLYIVDTSSARIARLTKTPDRAPSWNQDGSELAFVRNRGRGYFDGDVYLASVTRGSNPRISNTRLIVSGGTDPAFSPDGKLLAFARADGIYRLDLQTGHERKLLTTAGASDLEWTPGGILFSALAGGIRRFSGNSTKAITSRIGDADPTATNGGRILFTRVDVSPKGRLLSTRVWSLARFKQQPLPVPVRPLGLSDTSPIALDSGFTAVVRLGANQAATLLVFKNGSRVPSAVTLTKLRPKPTAVAWRPNPA